jgi:hypothetical protein
VGALRENDRPFSCYQFNHDALVGVFTELIADIGKPRISCCQMYTTSIQCCIFAYDPLDFTLPGVKDAQVEEIYILDEDTLRSIGYRMR